MSFGDVGRELGRRWQVTNERTPSYFAIEIFVASTLQPELV
jgi:hypothetical protein